MEHKVRFHYRFAQNFGEMLSMSIKKYFEITANVSINQCFATKS